MLIFSYAFAVTVPKAAGTPKPLCMINGQVLRRLRVMKGLNQKEAAQRLQISRSTYARLEQSVWLQGEKLHAILIALECTTADVEKAMNLLN
jgi:transcriptional regulator with XRE-family HTH domain